MPSLRDKINQLLDSLPLAEAQEQAVAAFRSALQDRELREAFDSLYVALTYPADKLPKPAVEPADA